MTTAHRITTLVFGLIVAGLGACGTVHVDPPPNGFPRAGGFEYHPGGEQGSDLSYALWLPPIAGDADYRGMPVILFLHGRGECGTDGRAQTRVGLGPALQAHPERWPFVVVMPQKPDFDTQWEDHADAALAVLDGVIRQHKLDRSRLYLTGLSQGGHGTLEFAAMHPRGFAAIAAVCGYVGRPPARDERASWTATPTTPAIARMAAALRQVPTRLYHGGLDDVVPPAFSESLAEALEAAGGDATLTIFPEDNHNSWDNAYADESLPGWFLSHTQRPSMGI